MKVRADSQQMLLPVAFMFAAIAATVAVVVGGVFLGMGSASARVLLATAAAVAGAMAGMYLRRQRLSDRSRRRRWELWVVFVAGWLGAGVVIAAGSASYHWWFQDALGLSHVVGWANTVGAAGLAGVLAAVVSLPFLLWIERRAQRVLIARQQSLVAGSEARSMWRTFVTCIMLLTLAGLALRQRVGGLEVSESDWLDLPAFFIATQLICIAALFHLFADMLDSIDDVVRIEQRTEELESFTGIADITAVAEVVTDIGVGDDVHGHRDETGGYRERMRVVPVVVGFVEGARFSLLRERKRAVMGLFFHSGVVLLVFWQGV